MDDELPTSVMRASRCWWIARDPGGHGRTTFLEAWELQRPANLGATMRAGQIRRANPALAAAIEREMLWRVEPVRCELHALRDCAVDAGAKMAAGP